jgi:mono/diheme cytochrome c family protein
VKSNIRLEILTTGLLSGALLSPGLGLGQKVEPTPENIAKGEAIYRKHCQMCHGGKGMGDGPAGKRLNPKPYDFTDKAKMAKLTDEDMFKQITKGAGPMPAFERKLKPEERWMVLHYVRTFSR